MKTLRVSLVAVLALLGAMGTAGAVSPLLKEFEDAFIRLGEEVRPCVVNIDTQNEIDMPSGQGLPEDFFRFFGIPAPEGRQIRPRRSVPATGSGFIYDREGHIITNNHVVADAESITVRLWNGKEYSAEVVGTDPDTDLAVIKIDADVDLPVAALGDSSKLKVGQFAVAMGSPRGLEGSLSFGHISALGRDTLPLRRSGLRFQNLVQTDAAINFGNSGGPLCNIDGEVIGINVAIVWGAESIGFAIPIDTAKEIVPELIAEGKITRGYLGVEIRDADEFAKSLGMPDEQGAYVERVLTDTPAERDGLAVYDVIRKVNGEVVKDSTDLQYKIAHFAPGEKVTLELWRDEKTITVDVKLSEYAGSVEKAVLGPEVLGLRVRTLPAEMAESLGLDSGTKGVVVADVEPNSAGELAGIEVGDVILEVAKEKVTDASEFRRLVKEHTKPGEALLVRVVSKGGRPMTRLVQVPGGDEQDK